MRRLKINRRDIKLLGITMVAGLFLGWLLFSNSGTTDKQNSNEDTEQKETVYTCSMHPQIKQNKPGLCPICAMDLVPLESGISEGDHINPDEIQMTDAAMALASVQTTIVKRGTPEMNIRLSGKIKADERRVSVITARFSGRIEKLYINFTGQRVNKGERLGSIYSPELIAAQKELLEAATYKSSESSLYKSARTKLKLWGLTDSQIDNIEDSKTLKTNIDILSPQTGIVTKREVTSGNYVNEGSLMFEVTDLSKLWVIFDAYESYLLWIKRGDKIEFTTRSVPGKIFTGKVRYIDPYIDSKTRVAYVRIEVSNDKQILKPDMFVSGTLLSETAKKSGEIIIPKTSVLWTGKRAVVYVKVPERKSTSFIYREIILGAEAGDFYTIEKGLSVGEEIATNGVFKIDAAAQLSGKRSMMNPSGTQVAMGHNHGNMNKQHNHSDNSDLKHEQFMVSGNCSMCKSTIEKAALSLSGVKEAEWNIDSKQLTIMYNSKVHSLQDIHKAIARSGYDTEKEKASDSVYNKLPACCKYDRGTIATVKTTDKQATFTVYGNCEMCKERIEKAAKLVTGVTSAKWNRDSNSINVTFNEKSTTLTEIHRAIAAAGHDTDKFKANDSVYNKLPGCCKYR